MNNIAFIFPGQGSQVVGMASDLFNDYACVRELFDEASTILGRDMRALLFDGPSSELDLTRNAQTALLIANHASFLVLKEIVDVEASFYAGHSLGEYSALVACGAIGFSDGLRLVDERARAMQEAVAIGVGSMCAVIGLDAEKIKDICAKLSMEGSTVVVANINCPGQVVISGHKGAVEEVASLCATAGAKKTVILKVSVPSHSPLMAKAALKLAPALDKVDFRSFEGTVVTNVEANALTDPESIAGLLSLQLTSPVRWVESVEFMRDAGINTMIEVGPGRVLSTLIRRIDRNIKCFRAGTVKDYETLVSEFNSTHQKESL